MYCGVPKNLAAELGTAAERVVTEGAVPDVDVGHPAKFARRLLPPALTEDHP